MARVHVSRRDAVRVSRADRLARGGRPGGSGRRGRLLSAVAMSAAIIVVGGSVTAIPFSAQSGAIVAGATATSVRSAAQRRQATRRHHRFTWSHTAIRGDRTHNLPERELFPGVMPLTLGAIGLAPPVSLGTLALTGGYSPRLRWLAGHERTDLRRVVSICAAVSRACGFPLGLRRSSGLA